MSKTQELLERQYIAGASVTNCLTHMGLEITKRPDDCRLCLSDLRNHMSRAIRINEWLNTWKNDATQLLSSNGQ